MGRDRDDLELVDLVQLLGLGHRRAGHPRQLVVETEVVLEGDRREGHALALDAQTLLRLDRLVEALAPAAAGHLATGELVDDDDLAVLDDVVAVALVERVGTERLFEVAGEAGVGVVHVLDAEEALHLGDPLLGRGDRLLLEVDEVVAAFLVALGPALEPRDEAGEREVQVVRLLRLAADDQRRARLVDEDVVDLVDDREAALALDPLVELEDHVVAQVVEPELVVGAVRDVRRVGLGAGDRAQVDEALVGGRVAGLEDERRVVGDHPDADAEEMEDRAHPLRVAAGEVVVDRHDVDAAAGRRVQDGGHRRDEGLALAGPHLGDLALVEDRRADQLDVEVAHAERPLHRLAGHREDLGHDLVECLLEAIVLALAAFLLQLAAALEVRVMEFVLGRLVGHGDFGDLGTEFGEVRPDLLVGEGLVFRLEGVGLVDHGLEASDLAVVRVDELVQEAHLASSIGEVAPRSGQARSTVASFGARACLRGRQPTPRWMTIALGLADGCAGGDPASSVQNPLP